MNEQRICLAVLRLIDKSPCVDRQGCVGPHMFRVRHGEDRTHRVVHRCGGVAGGEDSAGNTDRQGTFKGFLRLCIEQGDLP